MIFRDKSVICYLYIIIIRDQEEQKYNHHLSSQHIDVLVVVIGVVLMLNETQ